MYEPETSSPLKGRRRVGRQEGRRARRKSAGLAADLETKTTRSTTPLVKSRRSGLCEPDNDCFGRLSSVAYLQGRDSPTEKSGSTDNVHSTLCFLLLCQDVGVLLGPHSFLDPKSL